MRNFWSNKDIIRRLKDLLYEIIYIFSNYIVNNIPIWFIRKIFYRLLGMKLGKGSRVLMKTIIVCPWRISIGDNTIINEKCYLDGRGRIEIGSNVTIAIYSKLITGYHDIHSDSFVYQEDRIIIEDNVAVFANAVILAGVRLKHGCVIVAGAMIKRGEYEKLGVYAGNPCKLIGKRETRAEYVQDGYRPLFR